jgi:tetratricopeptide (TPR) repeat protein
MEVRTMRNLLYVVLPFMLLAASGCTPSMRRQGDRSLEDGRPAEAVRYYEKALARDAELENDAEFMASLRRARARSAYEASEDLAGQRKWEEAIAKLEESLENEPGRPRVIAALRRARTEAAKFHYRAAIDLADEGKLEEAKERLRAALQRDPTNADARSALQGGRLGTKAPALYDEAMKLAAEKKWDAAAELFRNARDADPTHLLARVELHRAEEAMESTYRAVTRGRELVDTGQLDLALERFLDAVETWPHLEQARTLLAETKQRRAEAETHYRAAAASAEAGEWEKAVRSARGALALFPHYTEATNLLARAAAARGDVAGQAGQWGRALLCCIIADRRAPKQGYADKAALARANVLRGAQVPVSLEVEPESGVVSPEGAALGVAVMAELAKTSPHALLLVEAGADGAPPAYDARVRGVRVDVVQAPVSVAHRIHPYSIATPVSNPEIPRLAARLRRAQRELFELRKDLQRPCMYCRGKGTITCTACGGTGKDHDGRKCRRCRGKRRLDCPHCHGRGRIGTATDWDVRRKEDEIRDLSRRLDRAPATVMHKVPAEWPYTVERYEITGVAEAGLLLLEPDTGVVVHAERVRKDAAYSDQVIQNANPDIGLQNDPLDLPALSTVHGQLADRLASAVATKLSTAVLTDRARDRLAQADELERAGLSDQALEARVAAGVLLQKVRDAEGDRLINKLCQGMFSAE